MADEATIPTASPAAPAEAAAPAAEVSTPASTPGTSTTTGQPGAPDAAAAEQVSSPSLISTADADKAKPTEAKAAAPEIDGKAPEAEAAKPATDVTEAPPKDAPSTDKPADGTAPADDAPAQEEPQARTYEAFKVPDGIKLAEKETKEFTDVLDDAKLSHQERGQKLVDLYVRESNRIVNELQTQQRKAWTDFTDGLKADFKADPELGGNRQDTTLGVAKAVIERFGGSPEQKSDLYAMLDHTGMGNHKGLVRVLNNVFNTYMRESSPVPGNPPSLRNGRNRQEAFYGSDG